MEKSQNLDARTLEGTEDIEYENDQSLVDQATNKDKKILVRNIYYMLCYVFNTLNWKDYENLASENFSGHLIDLLAELLLDAVGQCIKQGLWRNFEKRQKALPTVRGKIDINKSIRLKIKRTNRIACTFDEYQVDTVVNRIIKTTLINLCHLPEDEIDKKRQKRIANALIFFFNVGTINLASVHWDFPFHYRNRKLSFAMALCELIYRNSLQDESRSGRFKVLQFNEEMAMYKIFERFVQNYLYRRIKKEYRKSEIDYVNRRQIKWVLLGSPEGAKKLPEMEADIVIQSKEKNRILIIDTKYYKSLYQTREINGEETKKTYHSNNLYQILAYVGNEYANANRAVPNSGVGLPFSHFADDDLHFEKDGRNNVLTEVSGLLLYAQPVGTADVDENFNILGHSIQVKTVCLNTEFNEISSQLDSILKDFFYLDSTANPFQAKPQNAY